MACVGEAVLKKRKHERKETRCCTASGTKSRYDGNEWGARAPVGCVGEAVLQMTINQTMRGTQSGKSAIWPRLGLDTLPSQINTKGSRRRKREPQTMDRNRAGTRATTRI